MKKSEIIFTIIAGIIIAWCLVGPAHALSLDTPQPFGGGYEDEFTPTMAVQPSSSPQVTAHALFLQGNDGGL